MQTTAERLRLRFRHLTRWAAVKPDGSLVACGYASDNEPIADLSPNPSTMEGVFVADGALTPGRWVAVLAVEGERTTDDREIAVGACNWRELPIALTNAEDVGNDHYGAVIGRIETIERVNLGEKAEIRARGSFDLGSEEGMEAARLVEEQLKRWVSIDLEIIDYELYEEGNCSVDDTPDSEIDYYPNDECKIIMRVNEGRIMGAAMCAFSAFPSAVIVPEGTEIPAASEDGRPEPLAASAGIPVAPPLEWFTNPSLAELTPHFVTDDGYLYGYAWDWETCHIGYQDTCVLAPHSETDYAHYRRGYVECDCEEHTKVSTGVITMGTGHADLSLSPRAAMEHYDNTGFAVADVMIGEDAFGGWVAGALRPEVTKAQIRTLRGSGLSGDWRPIGGSLELVALLAVNVPGFPIVRARVASGEVKALVAAGSKRLARLRSGPEREMKQWMALMEQRLSVVEAIAKPLRGQAIEALANRMSA